MRGWQSCFCQLFIQLKNDPAHRHMSLKHSLPLEGSAIGDRTGFQVAAEPLQWPLALCAGREFKEL